MATFFVLFGLIVTQTGLHPGYQLFQTKEACETAKADTIKALVAAGITDGTLACHEQPMPGKFS